MDSSRIEVNNVSPTRDSSALTTHAISSSDRIKKPTDPKQPQRLVSTVKSDANSCLAPLPMLVRAVTHICFVDTTLWRSVARSPIGNSSIKDRFTTRTLLPFNLTVTEASLSINPDSADYYVPGNALLKHDLENTT
ncbi:uncharacterized protein LOC112494561 [Cephus cinctus]|uniref:Uncharacterized protein LOC112494561 n=1 Tax=Cephus cinctus TaxID=211228 RepID=A0AAJ7W2N5_CEPCN|nr:uncharacterized protein LOC112494561 [Cephus cinctus]